MYLVHLSLRALQHKWAAAEGAAVSICVCMQTLCCCRQTACCAVIACNHCVAAGKLHAVPCWHAIIVLALCCCRQTACCTVFACNHCVAAGKLHAVLCGMEAHRAPCACCSPATANHSSAYGLCNLHMACKSAACASQWALQYFQVFWKPSHLLSLSLITQFAVVCLHDQVIAAVLHCRALPILNTNGLG